MISMTMIATITEMMVARESFRPIHIYLYIHVFMPLNLHYAHFSKQEMNNITISCRTKEHTNSTKHSL